MANIPRMPNIHVSVSAAWLFGVVPFCGINSSNVFTTRNEKKYMLKVVFTLPVKTFTCTVVYFFDIPHSPPLLYEIIPCIETKERSRVFKINTRVSGVNIAAFVCQTV